MQKWYFLTFLVDPLMSILKLFVDTFFSFLKREVIIISLWIENIVVLDFINDNSKIEKMGETMNQWK